jgi:hypothetical protein
MSFAGGPNLRKEGRGELMKKIFALMAAALMALAVVSPALAGSNGQNGYEGQPGNQGGNGQSGYEGQPGNQGGN